MTPTTVHTLDRQHLWHPCSQMKQYETHKPLIIKKALGSILTLQDGKQLIDASSSWWCKTLGHQHPLLKAALLEQLTQFEHVLLADTTHHTIVQLSEALGTLLPGLTKVHYASDGSSAVEIALKMSLHARRIQKEPQRTRFIALTNSYHGETLGALSVTDLARFRAPYEPFLLKPLWIDNIPYLCTKEDPLWYDAAWHWKQIEPILAPYAKTTTAIIIEPVVQAAAGMRIYSQDFLRHICRFAKEHHIHVIADEIMTGFGRTGTMLACEHAEIHPDFICLGKGLTGGFLPLSAVITTDSIYDLFYDDTDPEKTFMHSHTYAGCALAARVALQTFTILKEEQLCNRATMLSTHLFSAMQEIADRTGMLEKVRSIGAIVAADLVGTPEKKLGQTIYRTAIELGALLRPLNNTLYWVPPLNMELETLHALKEITLNALLLSQGKTSIT